MAPPEVVSMKPCPLVPVFKERPILFSAPMVRALLDGSKTQTRRVVKGLTDKMWIEATAASSFAVCYDSEPSCGTGVWEVTEHSHPIACPYGQPGDRLYVRETHAKIIGQSGGWIETDYRATYTHGDRLGDKLGMKKKWTPAIHMPRAASRIDLEITGVRVERLQDISEADARTEGAPGYEEGVDEPPPSDDYEWSYRASFQRLWEQINGAGSWAANPWVWVVEFRRNRP